MVNARLIKENKVTQFRMPGSHFYHFPSVSIINGHPVGRTVLCECLPLIIHISPGSAAADKRADDEDVKITGKKKRSAGVSNISFSNSMVF